MTTWADEYMTMLEDCERREERLTDWERGFVPHPQCAEISGACLEQGRCLSNWDEVRTVAEVAGAEI